MRKGSRLDAGSLFCYKFILKESAVFWRTMEYPIGTAQWHFF